MERQGPSVPFDLWDSCRNSNGLFELKRVKENPSRKEGFCFVETRGVEPLTPCLQSRCSTN